MLLLFFWGGVAAVVGVEAASSLIHITTLKKNTENTPSEQHSLLPTVIATD